MIKLRSLFSGIEGFGLGFQMALGPEVEIVDQAEIDPFAIRVLEARYPNVTRLQDVRLVDAGAPPVDVLAAGFPCQPVSQAGPNNTKGRSYADDVRWLWPEVYRIMAATRPPLVLVENVRGLLRSGMREVVVGLAELGYAAQWDLIPAAAVGAPHLRHRVWIVAYPEEAPIGRVFERTPPVFAWPDETAALPRLARDIPDRKGRLSALGNAVVPECVAYLALEIARARLAEPLIPAGLFGVDPAEGWNGSYPVAGALLGGMLFEETSVAPKVEHRLWPTQAAQENGWPLDTLLTCIAQDGSSPPSDWNQRFYNRDTGQLVQKGLVQVVEAVERGLWPTPTASDQIQGWAGRSDKRDGAPPLRDAVLHDLFPTPVSSRRGSRGRGSVAAGGGEDLASAARLWPTPQVSGGAQRARSPEKLEERSDEGNFLNLADEARLAEHDPKTSPSTLNPRWVEWLMGYPLGWTEVE